MQEWGEKEVKGALCCPSTSSILDLVRAALKLCSANQSSYWQWPTALDSSNTATFFLLLPSMPLTTGAVDGEDYSSTISKGAHNFAHHTNNLGGCKWLFPTAPSFWDSQLCKASICVSLSRYLNVSISWPCMNTYKDLSDQHLNQHLQNLFCTQFPTWN